MPLFGRTNSSPNLRGVTTKNQRHQEQSYLDSHYLNEDEEFFVIGDRVQVDGHRPGSVAYFGETEFGLGDWVGVALDEPTGNHDGKLHGRQYFQCAPHHGLFVRPHRVTRLSDSALGSSASSSRCATPLPSASNTYQRFRYNLNNLSNNNNNNHNNNQINSNTRNLSSPSSPSPYSPSESQWRSSSRASSGSSQLGSYYYDDDYRQEPAPTVASLARKLSRIDERESGRRATVAVAEAGGRGEMKNAQANGGYDARSLSRTPTPVGILKHSNSSYIQQDSPRGANTNLSSRVDELNKRLRANSVSPSSSRSVFSFRPKREQLVGNGNNESGGGGGTRDSMNGSRRQRSIDLFGITEPPRKGDRVVIRTERDGELTGLLRFMGETNFATGEWAGVELDEPVGKNDGSILNHRYFYCPPSYGLFVPATRVKKYDPEKHGHLNKLLLTSSRRPRHEQLYSSQPSIFNSMRSTIKSPPPRVTSASRLSHQSGAGGSRSTTPSYNMDTLSPSTNSISNTSGYGGGGGGGGAGRLYQDYLSSESRPISPAVKTTNLDDLCTKLASSASPEPPVRRATGWLSYNNNNKQYDFDDKWHSATRAKFDDRDIELKLKQSLNRSRPLASSYRSSSTASLGATNRPKAIEYTFISSKLDGEPIARRTLIYE